MLQIVHFFELVDPLLVRDLTIMLVAVLSAEENNCVLPLIANPALIRLHSGPFCAGMHLEVSVFVNVLIEDQLGMA